MVLLLRNIKEVRMLFYYEFFVKVTLRLPDLLSNFMLIKPMQTKVGRKLFCFLLLDVRPT